MKKLYLGAILLLLCGSTTLCTSKEQHTKSQGLDGYMWTQWTHDQRSFFIWGYVAGFAQGQDFTCASLKVPLKWKIGELETCFDTHRKFSQSPYYYTDTLTAFFEKYPEDRRAPISSVLYYLSDAQSKSIDEIHTEILGRRFP